MSSRALRRAQRELEEKQIQEKLAQDDQDEDESEPDVAPKTTAKPSLFAMLGDGGEEDEEEDEEEQDARSRPVKRRQHMSPKAMEKSTSRLGKKRAFKATRWDRRKSVLPSTLLTRLTATYAYYSQERERLRTKTPRSAQTKKSTVKRKEKVLIPWKARIASTRQTQI